MAIRILPAPSAPLLCVSHLLTAGIQQLIGARMASGAINNFMGWGGGNGRTGRYRYTEVGAGKGSVPD